MLIEGEEQKIESNQFDKKEVIRAKDTTGTFQTVTAVPTYIPKNFLEQICIYNNSGTFSILAYDFTSATWKDLTQTIIITS